MRSYDKRFVADSQYANVLQPYAIHVYGAKLGY